MAEVCGNSTFFRVSELCVGLGSIENLVLDLRVDLAYQFLVLLSFLCFTLEEWVSHKDHCELVRWDFGLEFPRPEGVIIAEILIKGRSVRLKGHKVLVCD